LSKSKDSRKTAPRNTWGIEEDRKELEMENLKTWWAKQTKKTKTIVIAVVALLVLSSLSNAFPQATVEQPAPLAPVEESSSVPSELSIEELEANYFSDLDAVDPDFFVSQNAALLALRNICQSFEEGSTQSDPDEIYTFVLSYCGSDLASSLGVIPGPTLPAGVDTEEFATIALERWGIGVPESDGSGRDPVKFGLSLCAGDVDLMLSNLGDDFEGSFQQYALETFCPELLPIR
jgi:hypothetical protein